ncbi:Polyphosphoinositide phosphatase, partial [Stegodyphus mimosarum]
MDCLPLAILEGKRELETSLTEIVKTHPVDPRTDGFFDHYRPFEITSIADLLSFSMNHSMRDIMPSFTSDYSPFSVRVRPGRKRESIGEKPPNPSVTGISSTASASSGASDTDSGDSSSEDNFVYLDSEESTYSLALTRGITFENIFSNMKQIYGSDLQLPSEKDTKLYQKFFNIGRLAGISEQANLESKFFDAVKLNSRSNFSNDSTRCTSLPVVTKESWDIYNSYIRKGTEGPVMPSAKSLEIYQDYYMSKHQ